MQKVCYIRHHSLKKMRLDILQWKKIYKSINSTLKMFPGHYRVLAGFPCCGETLKYLQIAGKSYNYHGVSPQSVNITGFIHNIHRVSLWFLQPFFIDCAGFPCRDPVIPSTRSFHGVKICSAFEFLRFFWLEVLTEKQLVLLIEFSIWDTASR